MRKAVITIPGERLLTDFKLLEQIRQHLRDEVVSDTAVDDVWYVVDVLHHALPRLVHVREPLHLDRQLPSYVTTREHRFQVDPEVLDDEPVVADLQRVGQVLHPFVDFFLERSAISVTVNRRFRSSVPLTSRLISSVSSTLFRLIAFSYFHLIFGFITLTILLFTYCILSYSTACVERVN